jgi:CRISPR-associated exonuclease Cas4
METKITGTLIWYYYICRREVWLMSRQINAFQDNPFLDIGRYIQEESYKRDKKSIRIDNLEIDVLQKKNGKWIVGEVKKSSRFLDSARMQLAFYLFQLEKYGIHMEGELLFPEERKRIQVKLTDTIRKELMHTIEGIQQIINQDVPESPTRIKWCRNCAYKDFCFA